MEAGGEQSELFPGPSLIAREAEKLEYDTKFLHGQCSNHFKFNRNFLKVECHMVAYF